MKKIVTVERITLKQLNQLINHGFVVVIKGGSK